MAEEKAAAKKTEAAAPEAKTTINPERPWEEPRVMSAVPTAEVTVTDGEGNELTASADDVALLVEHASAPDPRFAPGYSVKVGGPTEEEIKAEQEAYEARFG